MTVKWSEEMKHPKIAMVATNLKLNGISSVIINYISHIDLDKYHITLIVGKGIAPLYRDKCKKMNVKIIELPQRKETPVLFYLSLYKKLVFGHYDIIHVHGSNASIGMELLLARLARIHIRIAHSHNTTSTNMKVHRLMKPIFNRNYNVALACGELAGRWLFGEKHFTIIPNGINIKKFKFSDTTRVEVRQKLKLKGKYVIGHVGRFNYQKNHDFIIQIFEEICKLRHNAVLLLVGNGPDFSKIKNLIKAKQLEDKIILYGETNNISDLYMAMDAFLFPSKFEGFPVTLIEAQVTGLPCLVSNVITPEVQLSGNLQFESLSVSEKVWAKKILSLKVLDRNSYYKNHLHTISNLEITNSVKKLESVYSQVFNNGE